MHDFCTTAEFRFSISEIVIILLISQLIISTAQTLSFTGEVPGNLGVSLQTLNRGQFFQNRTIIGHLLYTAIYNHH